MLDLYFGLDATGFEKSSESSSCAFDVVQTVENFLPHSPIPRVSGSDYDGDICMPQ